MSKKPKLDIAKNVNFITQESVKNTNNGDIFDELWGEDLDSSEVEKVEFVETLALSQMHDTTQWTNFSTAVQINQAVGPKSNNKSSECFLKATVSSNVKYSPRVPLRRVASSQWPSSSNFSACYSNTRGLSPSLAHGKVTNNGVLLQSDYEQLRLENKRLKEEIDRKTGESKILREKVNSGQKEYEKLKKEFSSKVDTLKLEVERTTSNLSKEIKSLKGQLDVKDMELETAERRAQHSNLLKRIHPDSPNNRHRTTSRVLKENALKCQCDRSLIKSKTQTLPLQYIRQCVVAELFEPSLPEAPISESVRTSNPRLFSGLIESSRPEHAATGLSTSKSGEYLTAGSSTNTTSRRELRTPHTSITLCASLLHSSDLVDIMSSKAHQIISQVVDICYQSLMELLKQLDSSQSFSCRFIEREREVLQNGFRQMPLDRDYHLLSHKEFYSDERGIQARRALGLMGLLVEVSDFAAEKILSRKNSEIGKKGSRDSNDPQRFVTPASASPGSSDILDVIRSIVRHIEKQRRTLMFQGVLAGTMILLKNLLETDVVVSQENQSTIVDILRWVVFARPGNLVIRNILKFLLAATRHLQIVTALCHNSDSCILQVLCGLVQNAETPRKQVLSDVFTAWLLSLFCGGQSRPHWINSAPAEKSCQCQPLVAKLGFHLLSEACLFYPTATGDDKKQLEKVLTRGVLLVHTFMNEGDHLLVNVDSTGFGCYEHFLHAMNNFIQRDDIKLDKNTRDILELLCIQEVQRQPANTLTGAQIQQLDAVLRSFHIGENGIKCPQILEYIDSL